MAPPVDPKVRKVIAPVMVPPSTGDTPSTPVDPTTSLDSFHVGNRTTPESIGLRESWKWVKAFFYDQKSMGCFEPRPNKHFVDMLRYAKTERIPLRVNDKRLGYVFLRRYGEAGSTLNNHWEIGFLESREQFTSWGMPSDNYLPTPIGIQYQLKNRVFDLVSPVDTHDPVEVFPLATYIDHDGSRVRVTAVNAITNQILLQREYDEKTTPPQQVVREIIATVNRQQLVESLEAAAPMTGQERSQWHETWVFKPLSPKELGLDSAAVQGEWDKNTIPTSIRAETFAPFFEHDLGDDVKITLDVTGASLAGIQRKMALSSLPR